MLVIMGGGKTIVARRSLRIIFDRYRPDLVSDEAWTGMEKEVFGF